MCSTRQPFEAIRIPHEGSLPHSLPDKIFLQQISDCSGHIANQWQGWGQSRGLPALRSEPLPALPLRFTAVSLFSVKRWSLTPVSQSATMLSQSCWCEDELNRCLPSDQDNSGKHSTPSPGASPENVSTPCITLSISKTALASRITKFQKRQWFSL